MIPPIALPDPQRMANLSVPRKVGQAFFPPPASTTEMSMPSISFSNSCAKLKCQVEKEEPEAGKRVITCYFVSLIYLGLALVFELGAAMSTTWLKGFPGYAGPFFCIALFVHGLFREAFLLWAHLALCLIFPFFVSDYLHVVGYLACFCIVVSYYFWRDVRGVWLILTLLLLSVFVCGLIVFLHTQEKSGVHACWLASLLLGAVGAKNLSGKKLEIHL